MTAQAVPIKHLVISTVDGKLHSYEPSNGFEVTVEPEGIHIRKGGTYTYFPGGSITRLVIEEDN